MESDGAESCPEGVASSNLSAGASGPAGVVTSGTFLS